MELPWHYQKEDNLKRGVENEELITKQILLVPVRVPSVARRKCRIEYVQIAVTIKGDRLYP